MIRTLTALVTRLAIALSSCTLCCTQLSAAELYWDINGVAPGAGGATPAGAWATNAANWTTDSTGSLASINWSNSNNQATFAAGTDATGAYTVTVGSGGVAPTATQVLSVHPGVRVNSGHVTLSGGTLTLSSVNFGGGFEIAPNASLATGTTVINRTGSSSTFTYLTGGGTLYHPGFALSPATNHYVVPASGTWDFNTVAEITGSRTIALSGSLANLAVIQGSGSMSRNFQNAPNSLYWTGGSGGGFAARGGTFNVTLTGATVTFGTPGDQHPGNGAPLILGSPTADSLVDFQSNLNLGTAAQNIYAWNPNNNPGNVARISGVISSGAGGSLTKLGTGTLELTNVNTYNGGTTVDAGTLLLNNTSGSAVGPGTVLVNANGTLGGSGSASNSVSVFGTLAPGNSTESLNIGSLTMQTNSTLEIEVGGLTPGATVNGYDMVAVTGTVALNNANLDLSLVSFTPEVGDTFFIVSNDGSDPVSGIFNGLTNDSTFYAGGQRWKIRYNANFGALDFELGSGNDIAVQIMAVPEPSTFALLTLSIAGTLTLRRRRAGRG